MFKRVLPLVIAIVLSVSAMAQSGTSRLTNKSGGTVYRYSVVVVDTSNDLAFTTTTTERAPTACGIAYADISNNQRGAIALPGQVLTVSVVGTVTRGDYLITSTTAGSAKSGGTSDATNAFGIALETGTDTDIDCYTFASLSGATSIEASDMADGDHGDFTYTSGVATLDADVVAPAEMADADHGDFTYSGGVASLDADVVAAAEMADADHGDISWSGGVASIDAGVVAAADMANADHGDFTYSAGVAALDADVVSTAEMADADHGDISWSGGVASIDAGVVGSTEIANGSITAADTAITGTPTGSLFLRDDWSWATPAGGGDVSFSALTASDNAIVRYDGATGTAIQGYTSGAPTISDTGTMTLVQPLVVDDTSIQIQEGVDTMTITVPALTTARAVTFPDAAGEVSLLGQTIGAAEIANGDHGDFTYSGGTATLDADTVGPNELAHLGIEALTDPNADRMVYWDDSDGAVNWLNPWSLQLTLTSGDYLTFTQNAASGDIAFNANEAGFSVSGLAFEGSSADTNEAWLLVTNPTADRTWTLPDESGHVTVKTPVILTAAGCIPTTTDGCTAPALDANDMMVAEFPASTNGFWQFPIPDDYDGSVENVVVFWYKDTDTNSVTWTVSNSIITEDGATSTGFTTGSSGAEAPPLAADLTTTPITDTDLLGASSATAGYLCRIRIATNAYTGGNANLLAVYIEY